MKFRAETILASFVVALFASFLTALAVLLVKGMATTVFKAKFLGDLVFNVYVLFFLSGFVFFKGSTIAAWLLYRHDVTWGYKLEYKKVYPIFIMSFVMAIAVFFSVYYYITSEFPSLVLLGKSVRAVRQVKQF